MKIINKVAFIVLFLVSIVSAQEQAEEILRWLPGEDYSFIAHYDLEKIRTKDFDSLLRGGHGSGFSHYKDQCLLPDSLMARVLKFTCGKYALVKVLNLSEDRSKYKDNSFVHTSPNSRLVNVELGGDDFLFSEQGYMLFIYRFEDIDAATKEAVKSGEFVNTGEMIAGNAVFSFKGTGMNRKKESTFVALAVPTGELLVAPSIKLLNQMYEAGLVAEGTFIRSEKYLYLKDIYDDLGSAWCYTDRSLINRAIVDKKEELQDEGEDLTLITEDLKDSGEFSISAVVVGRNLKLMEFRVFADAKTASQMVAGEESSWKVKENVCSRLVGTRDRTK